VTFGSLLGPSGSGRMIAGFLIEAVRRRDGGVNDNCPW
jgi:hypothetical protein